MKYVFSSHTESEKTYNFSGAIARALAFDSYANNATHDGEVIGTYSPLKALADELAAEDNAALCTAYMENETRLYDLLDSIVAQCQDHSQQIKSVISNYKKPTDGLLDIIKEEISKHIEGRLLCPHYVYKAKAEQHLVAYVISHWCDIDNNQLWHDFVRDAAKRIGLDDRYLNNTAFMSSLCSDIAHLVAKAQRDIMHADEQWVNMLNGTLVIKKDGTRQLRPHNMDDNLYYCLHYAFDPHAQCPMWLKFLDEVLPEHQAQDLLAEHFAYCLTEGLNLEKMLLLFGRGCNGKSVILNILTALMGKDNVSHVQLDDLTKSEKMRALIENKRVNISSESSRDIKPSILKALVTGEPVSIYINYIGPRTMKHYAKLVVSCNDLPMAENTYGFFRRLNIMPFLQTISDEKKDPNLAQKIIAHELPGIFNWALKGLERLVNNRRFTTSPMCEQTLLNYKLQADSVLLFVSECCDTTNKDAKISGRELYEAYKGFCVEMGIRYVGKQKFNIRLEGHVKCLNKDTKKALMYNAKLLPYNG